MAPPARQALSRPAALPIGNSAAFTVALVHEAAPDGSWAAVHVLVGAPARKVAAPIVQRHGHVAYGVRQVKADHAALGARSGRNGMHVEELSGIVLNATQQHQRDASALLRQDDINVLCAQQDLPGPRGNLNQGDGGVQAVVEQLGGDGVHVRGKGLLLDQNLEASGAWHKE